MLCKYCGEKCIKKGKVKRRQRYKCKSCGRYQQSIYEIDTSERDEPFVIKLCKEGVGIRSISRLTKIPATSVLRIINRFSQRIHKPENSEQNQSYEIDELRTYAGKKSKESWVIYAINKRTGKVIDMVVGRRTKANIEKVVRSVMNLNPKRI